MPGHVLCTHVVQVVCRFHTYTPTCLLGQWAAAAAAAVAVVVVTQTPHQLLAADTAMQALLKWYGTASTSAAQVTKKQACHMQSGTSGGVAMHTRYSTSVHQSPCVATPGSVWPTACLHGGMQLPAFWRPAFTLAMCCQALTLTTEDFLRSLLLQTRLKALLQNGGDCIVTHTLACSGSLEVNQIDGARDD